MKHIIIVKYLKLNHRLVISTSNRCTLKIKVFPTKIGTKNDFKSSSRARNNYREQKLGEKRNGSKVIQITRRAQSRHLQNHHPLTTHVAKNRREQWRSLIVSPVNTGTNFNCCPSESFFLAPGGGLIVKKATRCITRDN